MRMERLTARNENGEAYYPQCYRKDGCNGFGGDCDNCKFSYGVCETLAAYEDIDLTPDQLRQIDQLYREKCEELARYKTAIAEARMDSYSRGWKDALELIEGAIKEDSE